MLEHTDNYGETKPSFCFCFICNNPIETSTFYRSDCDSNHVHLSQLFCSIMTRYLNLDLFEATVRRTISYDKNVDKLDCCKSCSVIAKAVCKLYDEVKNLELHLNWNLRKIGEIMKNNTKTTNNQLSRDEMGLGGFKQQFTNKVDAINRSQYPHLKLDKATPPKEQIHTPENLDAHIIKIETFSDDDHDVENLEEVENDDDTDINFRVETGETLKVKADEIRENIPGEAKIKRIRRRKEKRAGTEPKDMFACAFCDERFQRKCSLKNHKRLRHKTQKLYKCRICGERFPKLEERRAHLKSHKVLTFKCRFCAKSFTRSRYRIRHEWTHTGLRPFLCSVCERRFNDFSAARRHVTIQHKNVDNAQVVKCFNSYSDFKVTQEFQDLL